MKNFIKFFISLLGTLLIVNYATSQNTVGLILNNPSESYNGFTLFSQIASTQTYLIDNEGYLIHSWSSSYNPAQAVMLLLDGSILRTASITSGSLFNAGGSGGRVEKIDWDGNLTWSFDYYTDDHCSHHDIEVLPNGNILLIAWERKTYDEAIAAGIDSSGLSTDLWSEEIVEVEPSGESGGNIVWQWHAWDHLIQNFDALKPNFGIVPDHPELINLNFAARSNADWFHINSVRYNSERDEILLSVHNFGEVWIIDHSTTTAEAASHYGGNKGRGGDLLYRWGNPQAYDRGNSTDQKLFGQHDARWIDKGLPGEDDILVFNNGLDRPDSSYSTVAEFKPPLDASGNYFLESSGVFGPDTLIWTYPEVPSTLIYSQNISGALRLPNGNTLICLGTSGEFLEVDNSGKSVWEYINPVTRSGILNQGDTPLQNLVFKVYKYAPNYSAFIGKDMSQKGTIEQYPNGVETLNFTNTDVVLGQNFPNPFSRSTTISYNLQFPEQVSLKVFNCFGTVVAQVVSSYEVAGMHTVNFNGSDLAEGVYYCKLEVGAKVQTKKMLLIK